MAEALSPLAGAADAVLKTKTGVSLPQWLADQVSAGASTRVMASRLHAATDGAVTPTHETVRRWVDQLELVSS